MKEEEECLLLQKIKKDPNQFGTLFDLYYSSIFNYIFRRVSDYQVSRDIASETFLKAFLGISSFTWKNKSLGAWLYRIATNEVNGYFRKNRVYRSSLDRWINESAPGSAEEYLTEKELFEQELKLNREYLKVQQALSRLGIKYQEVLSLRYFEKKSVLEISAILEKKQGTIKSLLSRGLIKLKIELQTATKSGV